MWIALVGGVTILLSWVFIGLVIFIMYRRLDQIESFLPTAVWVKSGKQMLTGTGWVCKFYRLSILSVAFLVSDLLVKRGELGSGEIQSVPKNLRYLVLGTYMLGVMVMLVAIVLYGFIWWEKHVGMN
jgi:hypothetical protein